MFHRRCLTQVTFIKNDVTVSEILKVIQDAGFTAELLQKQDIEARQEVLCSLCPTYRPVDTSMHALTACERLLSMHSWQKLTRASLLQVARLEVIGMHCSSCSTAVEKALNSTDGVKEATVSLSLNMAEVTYDPTHVTEVCHRLNQ